MMSSIPSMIAPELTHLLQKFSLNCRSEFGLPETGFSLAIHSFDWRLLQWILMAILILGCSWMAFHKRVVRKIVKPTQTVPGDSIESLWGGDLYVGRLRTRFGLRYDTIIDFQQIENALAKTLDVFPFVAGRLDQSSISTGRPFISNFDSGVTLELSDNYTDDVSSTTLSGTAWTHVHGFRVQLPPQLPGQDTPLFSARLVRFHRCNQSVVFFDFSHLVGDGMSYMQFLSVWSFYAKSAGECPGAALPPHLRPNRLNSRRDRLAAAPHVRDVTEARKVMHTSNGTGRLMLGFARVTLSNLLFNQRMQLRVSSAGVKRLKAALMAEMKPGEWASSYEVVTASFLAAKAAAQGPNKQDNFARVRFAVNLRQPSHGRSDSGGEAPAGFPPNFFGNAIGAVTVDVRGLFQDVANATSPDADEETKTQALVGAVRRLHTHVRQGREERSVVEQKAREWTAAQELLARAGEGQTFVQKVQEQNNDFFLASVDGEQININEWNTFDPLQAELGSGQRASGFIPMPGVNMVPNIQVLMPLDSSGDLVLPCCMPTREARRFLAIVQRWGLPFEIIS